MAHPRSEPRANAKLSADSWGSRPQHTQTGGKYSSSVHTPQHPLLRVANPMTGSWPGGEGVVQPEHLNLRCAEPQLDTNIHQATIGRESAAPQASYTVHAIR